jgi:endoglucanase
MVHPEIRSGSRRRRGQGAFVVLGAVALAAASALPAAAAGSARSLAASTRFAFHTPDQAAIQQVGQLFGHRDAKDAGLVADELLTPQADWFTKGTPTQVRQQVAKTVTLDNAIGTVPTLVVYNVPGRDCSQYSSGGAGSDSAYTTWIDGFVKGLGNGKAIIIVEPDGLANLPSDCPGAYPGQDIAAITASRIADIKYAGQQIESHDSRSLVYLDAGHSAWHSAGDMASRLSQAGVSDLQGFFLNVSNYQYTTNSDFYGTWLSDCLAYATNDNSAGAAVAAGDFGNCGDEYYNGGPATNWAGGALNPYGIWTDGNADLTLNTAGVTSRYASELGTVQPKAHFVVDTSRNGTGPSDMTKYAAAPYNQPASVITALQGGNWCNPPGAGLGKRPTASTGVALADAYLWVKTVGESDGQCNIAGGARAWDYTAYNPWGWNATQQANNDPLWGIADPAAGAWFGQQAIQLAQNSVR